MAVKYTDQYTWFDALVAEDRGQAYAERMHLRHCVTPPLEVVVEVDLSFLLEKANESSDRTPA